ncbi:MAG: hypothetical protein RLZZ338_2740 [Cyanobacteriota bacterium]|jgi:hypothetical protein
MLRNLHKRRFETFLETQRVGDLFSGEVVYSEPTTVVGTALGIVSLVQLQPEERSYSGNREVHPLIVQSS